MGWAERGGITPVVSSRREICRRGEHAGGARTVAPAVGLRHPRSRSRSHRGRLGLFRSDSGRLPGVRLVLCTRRISTAPACRVTSSHSPLKLLYGIIESLNGSSSSYTTVFWFPSPTTLLDDVSGAALFQPLHARAYRVLPQLKSSMDQNE